MPHGDGLSSRIGSRLARLVSANARELAGVGSRVLGGRPEPGDLAHGYLLLLLALIVYGTAGWPITAVDTDLWYHLNAGRFIVTHAAIPQEAFFSFLEPTPAWLDYSWLSQLWFYSAFSLGGYLGLVWLRALLVLATLGFVLATLGLRAEARDGPSRALFFTLVALFLLERFAPLRPHDLSHLLVATFVFLLESRRALLALPVLTVAWVNLHGVEYPVLLLIVGAYLGEQVLARLGLASQAPALPRRHVLALVAACACVLVTPFGARLLAIPFTSLSFASQYIDELRAVDLATLFTLRIDGLLVQRATLLSLLLLLAGAAALTSLRREHLRPAHLLLLAGGVFLLLRVRRFSSEFALLAVPALGAFRPTVALLGQVSAPLRAAALVLLALLPLRFLVNVFDTDCGFPLCERGLPIGTTAFLRQVDARGSVFNHPNHGGYLEWELHDRQKIFADLQTPFPFPDEAIFLADQAFQDPAVLAAALAAHHPAFLAVPRELGRFAAMIAGHPDYAPVFVDDAVVLYASARASPALVERFALRAIDPFSLLPRQAVPDSATLDAALAELRRINQIHPSAGRTRVAEGTLALQTGDRDAALRDADTVIRDHPELAEAFSLRGETLFLSNRLLEAAEAYEAALERLRGDRADTELRSDLQSRLWACYSRLGEHERAYRALKLGLGDLYRAEVGHAQLFSLATSALESGRAQEGRSLLEFALQKTPTDDLPWRRRILERLQQLKAAPAGP